MNDILKALRCLPDARGWTRAFIELAWSVPLILLFASVGDLVQAQNPPDAESAIRLAAILFVAPALGEEILFRGLIIPRDRPNAKWLLLSAALFVAWHPLQAFTIGPPWADVFLDPWFLCVSAVIGIALARIYAATGSLWPPILAHWLIVLCWKLFLGGPF